MTILTLILWKQKEEKYMITKRLIVMIISLVFLSMCMGCGSNEATAFPDYQGSAANAEEVVPAVVDNNDTEQLIAPASPEYVETPEEESTTDLMEKEPEEDTEKVETKIENKRPISVVAKDQTADSKIEYYDDGSYSIRVPVRQNDYLIYFFPNGVIQKIETYEFSAKQPEGELQQVSYYLFGISTRSQAYLRKYATIRGLGDLIPEFDSEGNIVNENYIPKGNTSNIPNMEVDPEGYIIERDSEGRIVKITENRNNDGGGLFNVDVFEISYYQDAIQILGYQYYPNSYDNVTRTTGRSDFEDGVYVIYNEKGQPIELQHIENLDKDGNPVTDKVTYFNYDQYGFLTSIEYPGKNGYGGDDFEYTY